MLSREGRRAGDRVSFHSLSLPLHDKHEAEVIRIVTLIIKLLCTGEYRLDNAQLPSPTSNITLFSTWLLIEISLP